MKAIIAATERYINLDGIFIEKKDPNSCCQKKHTELTK